MRFTFRQLEVFLAIAYHENITLAAHQLHMSQSAASNALKELELQFNIQLFDRLGKRLQINSCGKSARVHIEKLLSHSKEVQNHLSNHIEFGSLNIGSTMTIANDLAINLIHDFKLSYPNTLFNFYIANTQTITQRVENFELDIGMIEGSINHSSLNCIKWRDDELSVFCHPDHPLARVKNVSNEDLINANWIVREIGSGTRQTFDRAMHDILPKLSITLSLQLPNTIKQTVDKNLGLGCLSKNSLIADFKSERFIEIPLSSRNLQRSFYIIMRENKYFTADIERWLELCRITT
jgi:DNA-binding transcriptional LysR family regulator